MSKLKWHIIVLALWLAFSGVAAAEQLYVNESGWWCDGGAFNESGAPIQAVVGAADAGDAIYVHGGNYSENVNVNKTLTLEGEGADVVTVTAANFNDNLFKVTMDYVNISGFTVTRATGSYKAGIRLDNGVDHCNISDNNVSNNFYGICLESSSNNTLDNNTASNNHCGIRMVSSNSNNLTGNTANSNSYHCIWLESSSRNNLTDNNASDGYSYGIYMPGGSSNILSGNNASNNSQGIYLHYSGSSKLTDNIANANKYHGIHLWYSSNNDLTNNTVNSNGRYGIHLQSSSRNNLTGHTASDNDCDGIELSSSSNNNLTSNNASNNFRGILIESSSNNNNLTDNTASDNDYGIELLSSSSNTLTGNMMAGNNHNFGVYGGILSQFIQNIDTGNLVDEKPVYYWVNQQNKRVPDDAGFVGIVNSTNVTVIDLTLAVSGSGWNGIILWYSGNNTLYGNNASNNHCGIRIDYSSNNTLAGNNMSCNNEGINLWSSSNNLIYHNNLLNNPYGNAHEYSCGTNQWNSSAEGNYWDNYGGTDSNGDGIGEDSHLIPGGSNKDYYPLMDPWHEHEPLLGDLNGDDKITPADAVIVLEIAAGSRPCDDVALAAADVSRDGSVTSLDALMILQAACGKVDLS
jgi:parallel beta-helix repeat protein